jgi:predicted nucleic acid-binding Zn ribbon protein
MPENICKSCGKEILKGKKDYCSEYCKKSFEVLSSSFFHSQTKKCLKCGKLYENKLGKFCSLECATIYSLITRETS